MFDLYILDLFHLKGGRKKGNHISSEFIKNTYLASLDALYYGETVFQAAI